MSAINIQNKDFLEKINLLKSDLDKRCPFTKGELERLQEEFMLEFTYSSNAIEGNTLSLQETSLVLEGITIAQKPLKDHLEAVGHRDAFIYVRQIVSDKIAISEKIIKEIHSLILMDRPEDKGTYRRIPVKIAGAFHKPTEPLLITEQMESLVHKYNNSNAHPIEKATLFHLEFEGIHPFIDGNGRTGRLLLNLMLMQAGYPPINIKFTDRKLYYENFDHYFKNNSANEMLKMFAEYLEQNLKFYLSILN